MHVENYVGFLVSQGIIEEADQEIYCYGFKVLMFNAICILSVMAIGLFFGLLPETVSFLIGFFGMRLYLRRRIPCSDREKVLWSFYDDLFAVLLVY